MSAPGPDLGHSPSSSSTHSHGSLMGEQPGGDPDQCIDYSEVFPGDWNAANAAVLKGLGWSNRTDFQKAIWKPYVPYWTRPLWDPDIEVSIDGQMQRPTRGDIESFMRPAILERDRDIARTDYTRRWGINRLFPNTADGLARSGLSPVTAARDPPEPRQWTHEESWQTWWWDSFTSKELTDTGAYAPWWVDMIGSNPLSQRPDELIHPLFHRSRWAQPRTAQGLGGNVEKVRNVDLMYDLNGIRGRYDAEMNDYVWDALRPSLHLASLIILSGHPSFNMFLAGLYHMRRVPRENDGRTNKDDPGYREYQALWHDIDEDQMYDNARALRRLGFDAANATLRNLQNRLKWSFYEVWPSSNATTTQDDDGSIHIFISANNFWPLLSGEYTEGEKLPIRLKIASTMLHELCHACHFVHHNLLEQPELSLNTAGVTFTQEIAIHLRRLKLEALGDVPRGANGRNYFIENESFMEEGKAFEALLWGDGVEHFPVGRVSSRLRPMVAGRTWPWGHPKVYLQNPDRSQDTAYATYQGSNLAYKAYLLSPQSGVYDLYTPLPVSNYSRLFYFSWWQSDFQRYGPAALKNVSYTQGNQSPPLQSRVIFRYNNFHYLISPLVGNRAVLDFFNTAHSILTKQNHCLIEAWLGRTLFDIIAGKMMRLRLHYEKKAWYEKYNGIAALCENISHDIRTARDHVRNEVSGTPMGNNAQTRLDTLIRQDIPELHRLMDHESRYSQIIAAEYFLRDLDDRHLVRRSMHELLLHLQTTHSRVEEVQRNMEDLWSAMGASAAFTQQVEDCEALYRLLTATNTAISNVVALLSGNTLDQREGTHGPLAGVPVCQREIRNGRNLRIAALREFSTITDPKLRRVVQTWINLMQALQDIRLDDPDAVDYVVGGGTIAELKRAKDQATANALGIALLDRQDQAQASRDAGTEPGEGEEAAIHEIQEAMSDIEITSDITDLYADFSDDERARFQRGPTP